METGQETTVTIIGFAGALTAILMWVLSYFAPAFFMAAPPGAEAAVTTVLIGFICFVVPAWKLGGGKPPQP